MFVQPNPCARLECWVDSSAENHQKTTNEIGENLKKQYERWQPRARFLLPDLIIYFWLCNLIVSLLAAIQVIVSHWSLHAPNLLCRYFVAGTRFISTQLLTMWKSFARLYAAMPRTNAFCCTTTDTVCQSQRKMEKSGSSTKTSHNIFLSAFMIYRL